MNDITQTQSPDLTQGAQVLWTVSLVTAGGQCNLQGLVQVCMETYRQHHL